MTEKEINEFVTFPKTFEKYKWYKPILVFIIGLIINAILIVSIYFIFSIVYGEHLIDGFLNGGYETLNNELGTIISNLSVITMIPAVYIATKIVKDRPFSSYASSRGGWNFKLYFKAFIIPFILFLVFELVE